MKKLSFALITTTLLITGCKDNTKDKENTLTESEITMNQEQEEQWEELFNGNDLEGWKAFNSDSISDQWKVQDGAIAFAPAQGDRQGTENLITEKEYENFELSLEWKISEGGNSGIMWGVQEGEEFNEPYLTGPEIQVLDNQGHPDAKNGPIRQAGALYDMVPPSEDVTNPAGEWNSTVIRIDHKENKGTVKINDKLVTEFAIHGQQWEELVNNSKFKDWEHFGKTHKGHIALQDHSDKVWYRNIKIKELD
ncbi:3-keto-disaccharide hydrolase [Salegentibacter sp. F14]